MPIYEYKCPNCQRIFELILSIADKDKELVCPFCGQGGVQRLVSCFSLNTKGSNHKVHNLCSADTSL